MFITPFFSPVLGVFLIYQLVPKTNSDGMMTCSFVPSVLCISSQQAVRMMVFVVTIVMLFLQEKKAQWFWTSCLQKLWSQSKGPKKTSRGSVFHCWPGSSYWGVHPLVPYSLLYAIVCLLYILWSGYAVIRIMNTISKYYILKILLHIFFFRYTYL